MEAVNINKNEDIIKGLREQLEIRAHEVVLKNEALEKEKEKTKKANERTRKVKTELEESIVECESLKAELEQASKVEVVTGNSQIKIDKALFRLDTILMMNGEKESVSLDHLKLVVQDLNGAEQQTNLLLTK